MFKSDPEDAIKTNESTAIVSESQEEDCIDEPQNHSLIMRVSVGLQKKLL